MKPIPIRRLAFLCRPAAGILLALSAFPAGAAPVRDGAIAAELIAERGSIQPGVPFTIGLKLDIGPTWHTYWKNPGDAGFAPSIDWNLPDGFAAGPLQFPCPHLFLTGAGAGSQAGLGYEGQVLHLIEITPPASLQPGDTVTLAGTAQWLACDPATCVPGQASLSLSLPVTDAPGALTAAGAEFEEARAHTPDPLPGWKAAIRESGDALTITVTHPPGALAAPADSLAIYPENTFVIDLSAPQRFKIDGNTLTLTLPKHAYFSGLPENFRAVLVSTGGEDISPGSEPSILLAPEDEKAAVPEKAGAGKTPAGADSSAPEAAAPGSTLVGALLAAFLGGLILNLMPCVFPVISLKIMGFVNQAGESRRKMIAHGGVFAAGVLVSFWILTAILLAVRSAGDSLGWGFQLQEPGFVIALILLMVVMALSLFGVFEIGTGMTGAGGKLMMASGYSGSFWSGALATLLATPCTAPFMGAALGFALDQPPAISFLIFTVLALGMAFPYLILSAFPGWLKKLPRPGPWMETFKQIMGFPMLAVAAWLMWVLGAQAGNDALGLLFVALLLLAFGAWLMGRFAVPSRSTRSRIIARSAAILLAAAAIGLSARAAGSRPETSAAPDADPAAIIQGYREAGKNVFVDFTAKWCLVCQANKPAMHSTAVRTAFREKNVEFVIIDNTKRDPRIEEYINRFGRTGVPFYPLFPADTSRPPLILPQNLTPGIILDYLEKL